GAFFLSYGLANIFLSPLAESFGPKRSVILAIALFSGVTILSAPLGSSLLALVLLRLLLGLSQGIHLPMISLIVSRWFPLEERSRANALWLLGLLLELAVSPLLVVWLVNAFGWRLAFALLGISSLLVAIPLMAKFVQDLPQNYPSITTAELDYIKTGQVLSTNPPVETSVFLDWKMLLSKSQFWLAVLGGALNNFCGFGVWGWLPTYFNRAKGIDFEALSWPLTVVFIASVVGTLIMGIVGDRLGKRSLTAAIGCGLTGLMIYIATTMRDVKLLVFFFACAVFCQSAFIAQEYAIVQRLLPAHQVGSGTGLYNGLSVFFGGVGGSFVPGAIVAATGNFDTGMVSVVAGAWLAFLVMLVLARLLKY
ncbi:MAG: MFS transporter, partial [Symploca sp. SIO2D2]|nr:MFS transporter [Symploca sp. SIO2D2]